MGVEQGPNLESQADRLPPLTRSVDLRAGYAKQYLEEREKLKPGTLASFVDQMNFIGIPLTLEQIQAVKKGLSVNHEVADAIATLQLRGKVKYDGMLGDTTMKVLVLLYNREVSRREAVQKTIQKRETLAAEQVEMSANGILTEDQMEQEVVEWKKTGGKLKKPKELTLIGGSLLVKGGVKSSFPPGVHEIGDNGISPESVYKQMLSKERSKNTKDNENLETSIRWRTVVVDAGAGNPLVNGESAEKIMDFFKKIVDLVQKYGPKKLILMSRIPFNTEALVTRFRKTMSEKRARLRAETIQAQNTELAQRIEELAREKGCDFLNPNKEVTPKIPVESKWLVHPRGRAYYDYYAMQITKQANGEAVVTPPTTQISGLTPTETSTKGTL